VVTDGDVNDEPPLFYTGIHFPKNLRREEARQFYAEPSSLDPRSDRELVKRRDRRPRGAIGFRELPIRH